VKKQGMTSSKTMKSIPVPSYAKPGAKRGKKTGRKK
jgi:hypothetical protein